MRKLLATLVSGLVLSFAAAASQPTVIDINTADAATLARVLNGVGPAKADAIVAYREANGPFQHIDELDKVKGIGVATVELNRAVMSVQPAAAATPTLPAAPQPAGQSLATRPATPAGR